MPLSEKKRITNNRYIKKQDNITTRYTPGTKERIQAAAKAQGVSVNKFIVEAIEERLDDKFCEKLLDDYLASEDKGDPMPLDEFAESMGFKP